LSKNPEIQVALATVFIITQKWSNHANLTTTPFYILPYRNEFYPVGTVVDDNWDVLKELIGF
jgi:hypothetical protein